MSKTILFVICLMALVVVTGCGNDGTAPVLEDGLVGQVTDFEGNPVADAAIGLIYATDLPDLFAKPQTGIGFQLPDSSQVTLLILDAASDVVRTLIDDTLPGGTHSILWDATDDQGARVPNGLYWSVLIVEGVETDRSPLFLIDPDPASLFERANTHTDADGNFRIPRALVPTGVVIPVTDEQGGLLGDYPISRTVTVEVGRTDQGFHYDIEIITLPESWERFEVEISVPGIKPRD